MQNNSDHEDIREDILVKLISINKRLGFLSKIQVMDEGLDGSELSETFASFKNEMDIIIDSYQKAI